jgi:hypothetical protein
MKRMRWMPALLALFLCSGISKADIITPIRPTFSHGGMSASAEALLSVERSLSAHASIAAWAGGGFISTLDQISDSEHAWGTEGAIELRLYSRFFSDTRDMKRFFTGIYCGLGYMHAPRHLHGRVYEWTLVNSFGAKIGYKAVLVSWGSGSPAVRVVVEPYASAGFTFYTGSFDWNAIWVNLGLRTVLEIPVRPGSTGR